MSLCIFKDCGRGEHHKGMCILHYKDHYPKEPLTYTDENGNKLYGYSQTDMNDLKKAIYIVGFGFITLIILGAAFVWMIFDHYNLIDYIAFKMRVC